MNRVLVGACLGLFLILTLTGLTTSSLSSPLLRDDPSSSAPGLLAGESRAIRSDEYLRATPWQLGVISEGGDRFGTPLAYPDNSLIFPDPDSLVDVLVAPEAAAMAALGRYAPTQAFAAWWWLCPFMVAVLLPFWLGQLGVSRAVSVPSTALVLLAPSVSWWSYGPLRGLSWALLAAVCLIQASELRRSGRWRLAVWAYSAIACAGVVHLVVTYQPWAIVLGFSVAVPSLVHIARRGEGRRGAISGLLAVGVGSVALLAWLLYANWGAVQVATGTVYPGQRRASGEAIGLGQLFGAPQLSVLQGNPPIVGSNASELSSGYLVVLVAAAALALQVRWADIPHRRSAAMASAATSLVWVSWTTVSWPEAATLLVPLSLVEPARAAQVMGLASVITFALVLDAWRRAPSLSRWVGATSLAIPAFLLTASAGSVLAEDHLPSLTTGVVWLAAVGTAASLGLVALASRRSYALVPAVILAIPVVAVVNPLQIGTGDLTGGRAATELSSLGEELAQGQYGASDNWGIDAVLMANGIPSLSGQQAIGPNRDAWRQVDPEGRFVDAWNRGASFVSFAWKPGEALGVNNSLSPDVIQVTADPCDAAFSELGLRWIVSSAALDSPCLVPGPVFDFGGEARRAYWLGQPP